MTSAVRRRFHETIGDLLQRCRPGERASPDELTTLAAELDKLGRTAKLDSSEQALTKQLVTCLRIAALDASEESAETLCDWLHMRRERFSGDWNTFVLDAVSKSELWTARPEEAASAAGLSARTATDLIARLLGESPGVVETFATWVLLVQGDDWAVAKFEFEALPRAREGRGVVFQDPLHTLRPLDADFRKSLQHALDWMWSAHPFRGVDIRWRLRIVPRNGDENDESPADLMAIEGGSAGAAFGVGLACLGARRGSRGGKDGIAALNPETFALTAVVERHGSLGPVAGLPPKLKAILDYLRVRGVSWLGISDRQGVKDVHLSTEPRRREGRDINLVVAEDLAGMLEKLVESSRPISEAPFDLRAELGRHRDIVSRESILQGLERWVHDGKQGWLALRGSPGTGKSAILAKLIERLGSAQPAESGAGEWLVAYHFIGRRFPRWHEIEAIERHLRAQIALLLPGLPQGGAANPQVGFTTLLADLRMPLQNSERRLLVVLDGLDELDSLDGPALATLLPAALPPAIKFVVAMQPVGALVNLLAERHARFIDLDSEEYTTENEGAVMAFWTAKQKELNPPPSAAFIDEMIRCASGNMMVAVCWYNGVLSGPAPYQGPSSSLDNPSGLDTYFETLWKRYVSDPETAALASAGLRVLSQRRDPTPIHEIRNTLGWTLSELDEFRRIAKPVSIASTENGEGCLKLYHDSFRVFVGRRTQTTRRPWRFLLRATAEGSRNVSGIAERAAGDVVPWHRRPLPVPAWMQVVLMACALAVAGATLWLFRSGSATNDAPVLLERDGKWEFQWAGERWIGVLQFHRDGKVTIKNGICEKRSPNGTAMTDVRPIWTTLTPGRYDWKPGERAVHIRGLVIEAHEFEDGSDRATVQLDGRLELVPGLAGDLDYSPLGARSTARGGSGKFTALNGTWHPH